MGDKLDVVGLETDSLTKWIGLLLGPALFIIVLCTQPFDLPEKGNDVVAAFLWMLVWWITESVPLSVTALLPIVLFTLTGVMTLDEAVVPYSDKVVYLFFGGFIVALGLEEHNLHKRIALAIISLTGVSPKRLILGFMLATAFLSMWISNTATAVMMLPMALSVLNLLQLQSGSQPAGNKLRENDLAQTNELQRRFSLILVLMIAYAANIGGTATIIGTPPNLVMRAYLANLKIEISFFQWLIWALPIAVALLAIAYVLLVYILYPIRDLKIDRAEEVIEAERIRLGKRTTAQTRMLIVFGTTALLWMSRDLFISLIPFLEKKLTDEIIALVAAISLFVIPSGEIKSGRRQALLTWEATCRLPWGILLLFGGGLCLAKAFERTGVLSTLVDSLAKMGQGQTFLTLVILTAIAIFATEVLSNVALVTLLIPLIISIATGMGIAPIELAFPATIAASCAFMLPMATPPNAIVFSSGYITVRQMAWAGFWMNVLALAVIVFLSRVLLG